MQASSEPGDWVLDFFAGSGTLGAVAQKLDRHFVLIDENPEAIRVTQQRLGYGTIDRPIRYATGLSGGPASNASDY